MSSMQRRLRRNMQITMDELLFGALEAPDADCRDQRMLLLNEFRACMKYMNAPSAAAALGALQRFYDSWDHAAPSRWMSMIDNIIALREVEQEIRQESGRLSGTAGHATDLLQ